jgi:hypothetical protein
MVTVVIIKQYHQVTLATGNKKLHEYYLYTECSYYLLRNNIYKASKYETRPFCSLFPIEVRF